MANNSQSKLKTLYVMRILQEETDAEHGLTMRQIIERLADYGITAERKALYRDFDALREVGFDIRTYPRNPVEYGLAQREFTLPQLMLLVDAVASCKFLTPRQSADLVRNLKLLASDPQRAQLDRSIHVPDRIASAAEGVFESIDTLHEALRTRCQVQFTYYRANIAGVRQPTRQGRPHTVTPMSISFAEGNYYLTAWSDEHDSLAEFRIDRMGQLRITDEPATRNPQTDAHSTDPADYEMFGRFAGDPITVTLAINGSKTEIIMDRFGNRAQWLKPEGGTAKAVVKVQKSPQFFGWLAGLNGAVRIAKPESLRQEYRAYLRELIEES
ncbi:MAG: WYL domain-containing protein [Eggerthellaceae bacterium]|nr:WYL domain-containing protein [Eggerthellaceae bacterium]